MNICTDACTQAEREGDTYEVNGKLQTVKFIVCKNPFCVNYNKMRTRHEGEDPGPQMFMPPPHPWFMKP